MIFERQASSSCWAQLALAPVKDIVDAGCTTFYRNKRSGNFWAKRAAAIWRTAVLGTERLCGCASRPAVAEPHGAIAAPDHQRGDSDKTSLTACAGMSAPMDVAHGY